MEYLVHICMMNPTAQTQLKFCLHDQCAKAWPQQFKLQRERIRKQSKSGFLENLQRNLKEIKKLQWKRGRFRQDLKSSGSLKFYKTKF